MSETTEKDTKDRVLTEPDFINSKKYNYSLKKYKKKNTKEASDNIIAYFLCVTPEEVKSTYEEIIRKARRFMKIDL